MFGKRYPNCVKKSKGKTRKEEIDYDEVIEGAAEVLRQTATGGKQKEPPNYDYAALKRFYANSTGAGSVYEGNRVRKGGYTILGSGNKKDMSKGGNEQAPVDYRNLVMVNKQNKTGDNLTGGGKEMDAGLIKSDLFGGTGKRKINKKYGNVNLAHYEPDGELTEKVMTKKDIKKRDEIADAISDKEMEDRYGDKNVKYAIATKSVMDEKKKKKKKKKKMNEDIADEALLVQDWNKDDIKFTEIETVDVIKPKPIKEEHSNWRDELDEDWQSVNRKDKTDGMSKKAVKAYRKENPGSKLKTAVTKDPKKLKKGSKSAKRRLSFCRRMKGMKKKLTSAKTSRDPDSRINKALRRWNC